MNASERYHQRNPVVEMSRSIAQLAHADNEGVVESRH